MNAASHIWGFPETLEKLMTLNSRGGGGGGGSDRGGGKVDVGSIPIPVDVLDCPKEFIFFLDLPGLSKSDIQVTVEDENTLVIRSNGKRKREEEGCKYLRLERKAAQEQKLLRKLRLSENCDVSAITAKCENGVLTVVVGKQPPAPKPNTVQVTVS